MLFFICLFMSFSKNMTSHPSRIFMAMNYYSDGSRKTGLYLGAGNAACDVCMALALAGSGATLGGSIIVGLAISG